MEIRSASTHLSLREPGVKFLECMFVRSWIWGAVRRLTRVSLLFKTIDLELSKLQCHFSNAACDYSDPTAIPKSLQWECSVRMVSNVFTTNRLEFGSEPV